MYILQERNLRFQNGFISFKDLNHFEKSTKPSNILDALNSNLTC